MGARLRSARGGAAAGERWRAVSGVVQRRRQWEGSPAGEAGEGRERRQAGDQGGAAAGCSEGTAAAHGPKQTRGCGGGGAPDVEVLEGGEVSQRSG